MPAANSTKLLPHVGWREESADQEGFRFGTALDDLIGWALENGYSADDVRERVEDLLSDARDRGRR